MSQAKEDAKKVKEMMYWGGKKKESFENPVPEELIKPQEDEGHLYNVKARRKDNKDQWDHLASFRCHSVDDRKNRVVEVMKRLGKKKGQYDAFMSELAPKIPTEQQDDLFKAIGVNAMR